MHYHRADYLFLGPGGKLKVWRNVYPNFPKKKKNFVRMKGADAAGIGQRHADITFADVNGDGESTSIFLLLRANDEGV